VFKGARVGIGRRDGEVVYIISAQDLRLLEALEDRLDAEDVPEALARHQAAGGHTVSLDELKRHIES
jgi:PHD/YefM family antitoxin component YafN of YafNO toxin-antitoxin module